MSQENSISFEGAPEESLPVQEKTEPAQSGAFEHQKISYKSKRETFNEAETAVRQELFKFGWPEEQVEEIAFAVREAVINGIVHGNLQERKEQNQEGLKNYEHDWEVKMDGPDGEKTLELEMFIGENEATISVKDEGDFMPEVKKTDDPEADEKAILATSGRGLAAYIRPAFDKVEWEKGKIIMTVKKKGAQDLGWGDLESVKL
jgi:anti-sigma regulatory factor (Ser/Thr protein kinase)